MKKILSLALSVGLCCWHGPVLAGKTVDSGKHCSPTNIQYCKKGRTFMGKKYTTYTVRCSDGTKRTISAWDDRKKWCVGESDEDCATTQLKAARQACRN